MKIKKLKNPYILDPDNNKTNQELFEAITFWWKTKRRKKEGTIKHRLSIAKRMSTNFKFLRNESDYFMDWNNKKKFT